MIKSSPGNQGKPSQDTSKNKKPGYYNRHLFNKKTFHKGKGFGVNVAIVLGSNKNKNL